MAKGNWKQNSTRTPKVNRSKPKFNVREQFDVDYFEISVHRDYVEKLQYEIVLAKYRKDTDSVKRLQTEILKSRSAKVLAVKRVVSNKGIRSKGLSKPPFEFLETNVQYEAMINELDNIVENPQLYSADPLDRILILKPNGEFRPLSIPSYRDRCLQALIKFALDPIAECSADRHSYGFRKGRSPAWAAKQVLLFLKGPNYLYQFVLELDIKKCFDRINHDWILNNIEFPGDRRILIEWLKCGLIERPDPTDTWIATLEGVPQGGIISPIIANMTLDKMTPYISTSLDRMVNQGTFKKKDISFQLIRFADDAVILCRSYEVSLFIKKVISTFLVPRGLELNENKTHITNLYSGIYFKFVGYEFVRRIREGKRSTKIIPPRDSVKKLLAKITNIIRNSNNIREIVHDVNSLVRGWGYFYSIANSKNIFRKIDHLYTKMIYKRGITLLKEKNSQLSYEEIGRKFDSEHIERISTEFRNRDRFVVRSRTADQKDLSLFSIVELQIVYGSVRAGLNAYLPGDKALLHKCSNAFRSGLRTKILIKNDYVCQLCGAEVALDEESWEIHHKQPSAHGGTNKISNLIPLCTTPCHKDVSRAVSKKDYNSALNFVICNVLVLPQGILETFHKSK